jgi:hypothetical protein
LVDALDLDEEKRGQFVAVLPRRSELADRSDASGLWLRRAWARSALIAEGLQAERLHIREIVDHVEAASSHAQDVQEAVADLE